MKLIDRLARRLGYYPAPPTELIIFYNADHAHRYGFRGHKHPDHPHLTAWWPGAGERPLRTRGFMRITMSESTWRHGGRSTQEFRAILRALQMRYGDDAMWIEL